MTDPLLDSDTVVERYEVVTSWVGRIVDGRDRVLEKLGEGGMGTVYTAEHLTLHKHVALKTILPRYGELSARFEREAMATRRLDHPHVVSATDVGSLPDGGAYLDTRLVRGNGVEERLQADGEMKRNGRVCARYVRKSRMLFRRPMVQAGPQA